MTLKSREKRIFISPTTVIFLSGKLVIKKKNLTTHERRNYYVPIIQKKSLCFIYYGINFNECLQTQVTFYVKK